jgi:hypothetical protein
MEVTTGYLPGIFTLKGTNTNPAQHFQGCFGIIGTKGVNDFILTPG